MKKYLFILLFSCATLPSFAQTIPNQTAIQAVQFADANGRILPAGAAGVQGTPYVFEKFVQGKVIFVNGMESLDSNLNYSYADHKLYYTQKNGLYVVNQQAKEFTLYGLDKDKNKISKQFMCLFPSIEDNTPATFYEVLGVGGNFQLLKYTSKRIKESAVYGGAPLKEYVMDNLFYIYDKAAKKMLSLGSKLSLKSVKKTLPNYAAQMDAYVDANKLNLKKEEDMIQLLQQLK
ncbi:MAG: hypothetical protein ACOYKI_06885 [Sediminibacterium sp.]